MTIRPLFTLAFWLDAAERSIKSFAQGAIAVWGVGKTPWIDASLAGAFAGGAATALLSILTSVASAQIGGTVSPASALPDAQR